MPKKLMQKAVKKNFSISLKGLQASLSPVGNPQGNLVILGSGFGAFNIIKSIDTSNYNVSVVSPKNHFTFTPLLAQTSVGTLELRSAIEPIRVSDQKYHQASCDKIDFDQKTIQCKSALNNETFNLKYDKLIIATGAKINTFNIPGVDKYAHFLKDISNARDIRKKILSNLEQASLTFDVAERKRLLTVAVVGSGPTGCEFASELKDFIEQDVSRKFPELIQDINLSLYDVAPRILPTFTEELSQYASDVFKKRGIKVNCNKGVTKLTEKTMTLNDGSEVPYGILLWSAGIKQVDLINGLQLPKDRMKRMITNEYLEVLDNSKKPMKNVYALGDCATIEGNDLPCTAQVARQKGIYLAQSLNYRSKAMSEFVEPFKYTHRGSMCYVGNMKAIVQLNDGKSHTGLLGGLIWRGAYMSMANSWRNRVKIPTYWFLTAMSGREVSHFK